MDKGAKTKKPLVRGFSAGGAVFRRKTGIEWLLIKPAGTERWQLPKGNIDQGESAKEAGVREVFEETGIRARALDVIGSSQYFYFERQRETSSAYALSGQRIFKTVKFFLMEARGGETRTPAKWAHEIDKVLWLEAEAALKKLTHKDERLILEKAEKMLKTGLQEPLV